MLKFVIRLRLHPYWEVEKILEIEFLLNQFIKGLWSQ